MKNRAIFIDRDGTINEEVGFLTMTSQFRLFGFAAEAIRLINDVGWRAIVVTNQSGIARGLFTEESLAELHAQMERSLEQKGALIDAIYYCPHHPDFGGPPYRQDCNCRKPKPGLLEKAARDFSLDLKECHVIGDRYRDVEMGRAVGARSVLVMTGYGREEYRAQHELSPQQPDHVAENLLVAVRWILNSEREYETNEIDARC
ncbi:MAG: D-glycero-beta-D-manno-heptose 1,7-bisphosphate 7-phosphatase [Acidobacteria bacterium]|nr:D-glycero-beta-D-manno-heptose 1,7-bisphosphate 7-phosphatase [Acidobacteriota bacterium]